MERDPRRRLAELEEENRRLRRSVEELSALAELASSWPSDQSLQSVIELIVHKCVRHLDAEQGAVYWRPEEEQGGPLQTLLREGRTSVRGGPLRLGDELLGWMLEHRRPLTVNNTAAEEKFSSLGRQDPPVQSLLACPLRFHGRLTGVLAVFNKRAPQGFSDDDRRLLGIIAGTAAPILETARMIGELHEDRRRLANENSQLWREVQGRFQTAALGSSLAMQQIAALIERVCDADVDVLITGESGVGKEVVAKTIHYRSRRSRKPFIALNCAALPENLLESELFGIEKGVATGVDRRVGQFEAADGGTLFLDEIGDLPAAAQAKILRALQERTVQRVGGREPIPVNVRVLAATNHDLEEGVRANRFREDLYYRLNVIQIRVPPLRERREDIETLAQLFLAECRTLLRRPDLAFAPDALAALRAAPWPGNVRQLQNEVKRAAICAPGTVIRREDLSVGAPAGDDDGAPSGDSGPLDTALADYERRLLVEALRAHDGNQARTATTLGVSRQGLIKKMKRLGIASVGA